MATTNQPLPELKVPPVLVVLMIDDCVHLLPERPFCEDDNCPCHSDAILFQEFVMQPLDDGLLTYKEAFALYWNRQVS